MTERGMDDDGRGKRVVAVIHCVLNHNARVTGAARYAGMNDEVVDILKRHAVGVYQMPCPEMACLGLARRDEPGATIRNLLDTPAGRSRCREIAAEVADALAEYQRHGYAIAAVLGGDVRSPGCAVPAPSTVDDTDAPPTAWGVFTAALVAELSQRGIEVPIRGIRDSARATLLEDLEWLDSVLAQP